MYQMSPNEIKLPAVVSENRTGADKIYIFLDLKLRLNLIDLIGQEKLSIFQRSRRDEGQQDKCIETIKIENKLHYW